VSKLDAIKSRLGSISPTAMERLPAAVQKLLKEDVPWLLSCTPTEHELYGKPHRIAPGSVVMVIKKGRISGTLSNQLPNV